MARSRAAHVRSVVDEVRNQLESSDILYGPYCCRSHALTSLQKQVRQFRDAIERWRHKGVKGSVRAQAVHIAAVAIAFIVDCEHAPTEPPHSEG